MKEIYTPEPIDTTKIKVSDELKALAEKLAKNTHEVWSKSRISQGWAWGEFRDDERLKHPDLKPYEELSEQEKDYDRNTSMETIKVILSLGYQISKK